MSNSQQLARENEQRIAGLEIARESATGARKAAITKKLHRAYAIRTSVQARIETES